MWRRTFQRILRKYLYHTKKSLFLTYAIFRGTKDGCDCLPPIRTYIRVCDSVISLSSFLHSFIFIFPPSSQIYMDGVTFEASVIENRLLEARQCSKQLELCLTRQELIPSLEKKLEGLWEKWKVSFATTSVTIRRHYHKYL